MRVLAGRLVARRATPDVVVAIVVVGWCAVFGDLVYLRQARFESFDFDMGIFDQALWLLAHGHSFITVRGLAVFGQHASIAFYLLVPFYWLGAGPTFLNEVQILALGVSAGAVYQIARFHLGRSWLAVGLAAAFLLHPSTQWFAWELFHPEVVAMAPLLLAYLAALHRRWGRFAVLAVLAMAWKEDVALAVAALGVVLIVRGERRAGALTLIGGLIWFLVATEFVSHEGHGVFYSAEFYGGFGSTGGGIAFHMLTEPVRVLRRLHDSNAPAYALNLLLPYGLASLLSPLALLVGLPQAFLNLVSLQPFTWKTEYHYAALPLVATTIAMVEGVARVGRARTRSVLAAVVLASSLAATVISGVAPISRGFTGGIWPLAANARQASLEAAVRTPPASAVVSASYLLVPHLTHRQGIYSFPNPWIPTNFGKDDSREPNPGVVGWIMVQRQTLDAADVALLNGLVGPGKAFRVVSDRQDVVVAQRRRRHPHAPPASARGGAG